MREEVKDTKGFGLMCRAIISEMKKILINANFEKIFEIRESTCFNMHKTVGLYRRE